MQELTAFAVEHSSNSKIGVVHATYASQRSCPKSCAFFGQGCYAESGMVNIWTRRVNQADPNADPLTVAEHEAYAIRETLSGKRDLRLHIVGDCSTTLTAHIVAEAALATVRRTRSIWTYTHAWRMVDRHAWGGVSVLASTEHPDDAKQAMEAGWAAAMVVPSFQQDAAYTAHGLKILPCVNQTRAVQCTDCRLCWDAPRLRNKGLVIGFTPHGSRRKTVARLLAK